PKNQQKIPSTQPSLSTIYGWYDSLMSTYSSYITKIDCDADMNNESITKPAYMGSLNTYMYKFEPEFVKHRGYQAQVKEFSGNRASILISTGTHGNEYNGIWIIYCLMKWICEEWSNDVNADELRSQVTIYVLPCANPTGVRDNTRKNANGVDL